MSGADRNRSKLGTNFQNKFSEKSVKLRIINLTNDTTHTAVQAKDCFVAEYLVSGLAIEIPVRSCARGHHVSFTIETVGARENIRVTGTAVVKILKGINEKRDRIRLRFVNFDHEAWKAVHVLFRQKQEKATELFQRLKG